MSVIGKSDISTVSESTFSKRKVFFQFVLGLSIIGSAFFILIAFKYPYLTVDISITNFLQQINNPLLSGYLYFITLLGNSPEVLILISSVLVILLILKRHKDAIFLLISSLGIILISETLKDLIHRPRPTIELIHNVLPNLPAGSFPSGHVLFFCGFFGGLLFLVHTRLKSSRIRTLLIIGLLVLIFSVGLSRVYLGAHWSSDVIGSYFIGFIWLDLMSFLYRYLKVKF